MPSLAPVTDFPPPTPPGFPPPPPPSGFPPPPPGGFGAPPPPGYATTYGTPAGPVLQYASFGARLGAWIIDGLLMTLLVVPAFIMLTAGPTKVSTCSVDSEGNITIGEEINAVCEVPTAGTWAAAALLGLASVAGSLVYYARLEGGPSGQTLGKRAVGIRVADATTGGPIGSGRALGRYLFKAFISGNICFLGYLWMLWDGRNQAWHDKVVTSVVVKA